MTMTRCSTGLPPIFVDFLLILLLAFVLLLNPPGRRMESPGNMSVAISWPEGAIDIDLWLMGPGQKKPVGYSNKGGRTWNLLRDDTGIAGDNLPVNYENAYTRGLPAGEYVINIHGYRIYEATPVYVELRKGAVGKRQDLLFSDTIIMSTKQEKTAVRFRLDRNGNVIPGSVNRIFVPLIGSK